MATATSRRGWRLAIAGAGLALVASAFGAGGLATGRAAAAARAGPSSPLAASGPPPPTAPPTTLSAPTLPTTTVAPLSTLPVTPTTNPLVTKPQSAHVSGVFVVLSIAGFGLVVLMMLIQLFLTRAGRERRGARTL